MMTVGSSGRDNDDEEGGEITTIGNAGSDDDDEDDLNTG